MIDDRVFWPQQASVGEVMYPPGSTFGPRWQPNVQLVLIHLGSMTVWIDGVAQHAGANTVSILLPNHEERFAFASDHETWHTWLHAYLPDLPDQIMERIVRLPWSLPLSPPMHDLIRHALALRDLPLTTSDALLKALAAQMLWRYIGEGERVLSGGATLVHPAIERAQQFIAAHLAEPLILDQIAAAAAISPAHLVRLFRAELGTTPIAYLWQRRVASGIDLLVQTGLPIGVIALRCGFQTSYHFSRRIREATGSTPQDVRRRGWGRR